MNSKNDIEIMIKTNKILKLIDTANEIKTFLVEKFGVSPSFTIRGRSNSQTIIGTF